MKPMSSLTGINIIVFFVLNLIGTLMWVASVVLFGFFFHEELELVAQKAADTGLIAGVVLAAIVAVYFAYKIITQQRFLRSLRMRRLTAEDVHRPA
jgi:membrane protein DedA with SNARE-associated domain